MASFVHPTFGLLPIVPVQARVPYRESLSFLTDVMTSYDGTEGTRLALRNNPRQRLDSDLDVSTDWAADTHNTVRANLATRWLVPLWSQPRAVGDVAPGATVVSCDTRYADFRVDAPVLLVSACGVWHVSMVTAKDDTSLTLTTATTAQFYTGYVMPVRIGRLIGSAQKQTTGYGAQWRLNYEVYDNLGLTVAAPDQYYGDDIYFDVSLLVGDTVESQPQIDMEVYDGETGAVKTFPTWTNPRDVRSHRVVTETDEEAWLLRKFIYRREGRNRAFWQPTFENDIRLAQAGAITGTITVKADSRSPFATDRVNIAVGLQDGTWLPRRVTGDASAGADNRTLTLDTALNINADDIRSISYLGLKRLNSDTVNLSWVGNGRCVSVMSVLELQP